MRSSIRTLAVAASLALVTGCARGERDAPADSVATTPAAAPATTNTSPIGVWAVNHQGTSVVRAGMTVAEAAAMVPGGLTVPAGECVYATTPGAPAGLRVMVERGRVARVEVTRGDAVTAEGARIGDSEARIDSLYAGRVTTTPAKYDPAGHVLTVTPSAPADSAYRLVFETDGRRVTRFRSGVRPPVEYVEGCG